MTMWLKQSTAATIKLGPFVDDADGVTALTALTISQSDVRLSKNGGDFAQKNESSSATHDELGYYDLSIDTTDTNTLGRLKVVVSESGALPVWQDFMVVPANVWDSLFGADKLQVHADEITAGLITAAAIATDAIDADALANDAIAEINATVDTALSDYDAPTKAELDAGLAPLATQTSVDDLPTNAELATALASADDAVLAAIAALNDLSAADILTTALTESYAAQGAAPTLTQAVLEILQFLTEKGVVSTTVTVNQRDGATEAATYTLDDATTPTSIERAA